MELALDIFGSASMLIDTGPATGSWPGAAATTSSRLSGQSDAQCVFLFAQRDDLGRHEPDPTQYRRRARARSAKRTILIPTPDKRWTGWLSSVTRRGCSRSRSCCHSVNTGLFIYIGVMVPLLPRLIEEQFGGNEIDIGLTGGVQHRRHPGPARLGRFAEKHGLRSTMVSGAWLAAVATAACTFIDSRWGLLPLRCLQGIGEHSCSLARPRNQRSRSARSGRRGRSYFSSQCSAGWALDPSQRIGDR